MQEVCQHYLHGYELRLVTIENVNLNPDYFDLPCKKCGFKRDEHTGERVQATRSLSFTLRSLVKLMKVSISRIYEYVKN